MMLSSIQVNAENGDQLILEWKSYPYLPAETDITFPYDEGMHDIDENPIEWWYINLHLKGQSSGNNNGSFLAFYQIDFPDLLPQLRVFSISDIDNEQSYTNVKIGTLSASEDYLNLEFIGRSDDSVSHQDSQETTYSKMGLFGSDEMMPAKVETLNCPISRLSTDEIIQEGRRDALPLDEGSLEYWRTKTDEDGLVPFQYEIVMDGIAQEEGSELMQLDIDIDCIKKPLLVGGDGLIDIGDKNSYYYSLTKCVVSGTITIDDMTEPVVGEGWIDHQWGNYVDLNLPKVGLPVLYEWFSIKVDNHGEILTGDCWWRDTGELINEPYADGLHWYHDNGILEILEDYTIEQLDFWTDEDLSDRTFAVEWQITEESREINLTIKACFDNQMMRAISEYHAIQFLTYFVPGSCFWEGACTVTGTIGGEQISGYAYAESTHSWEDEND